MAYIADARFSDLIQQLEAVHLSEVKQLRLENQRLRAMKPIGVHDVDVKAFNVDIDNPDLGNKCNLNNTDESQDSVTSPAAPSRDRESCTSRGTVSSAEQTSQTDGQPLSPEYRPSRLRRLSRRSQGYEKRMHWATVPESAQAAWEQATDFDSIEEYTTYTMLALSRPGWRNSMTWRHSAGRRDAKRKLSRPSALWNRTLISTCMIGMPMVDPGTTYRVAWDFIAAVLIVYDLITIPLLIFDLDESLFTELSGWSCLIFWTLDILASGCTGIYIDGHLVMSRSIVVRHYVKSWFIVDCIAVVPDWVLKILDSAQDLGRLGGVVRMARGTRVLRLLRLAKLKKLMNEFYDMISSEYMFIVVDLVKLLTMILVLNHIIACLWYAVGLISLESGGGLNWLEDVGRTPVYHGSLAWKYTTCLHWSITQFTAASLDIFATNTGERIFSVLIIFWGLLGLSSFVGSVTATITALRNMSNDHHKQFWLMRKYLAQCRISHHLTCRILRYLEFKTAAKKNILPCSKVTLLSQLSEQLRSQLKKETNNLILDVHPFFSVMGIQLAPSMDQVCNQALIGMEYAEDDVVFSTAQEAAGMFFVKSGSFRYSEQVDLQKNSFMSEAALWTCWSHRESLVAIGIVNEVTSILHEPFGEVMCMHPQSWNFAQSYASDFIKALNDHDLESLSDISMNDFVNQLSRSRASRDGGKQVVAIKSQSSQSTISSKGSKLGPKSLSRL